MNMLSKAEIHLLAGKSVCVIGCGGLGGYIIEMLGRLGVGTITAIDNDVFDETNLNRQLLSENHNIGKSKAEAARIRMLNINPSIQVFPIQNVFNMENGVDLIQGHDVVMDAVDNISVRMMIEQSANEMGIPMIHGAIGGWYGQVTTIFPGDHILSNLYQPLKDGGVEKELGNPSFTPGLVASIQVSECLKILIGRGDLLRKKLLYIDLYTQDYEIIPLV
ncbi:MAG: HesA/MoeB/ThiF family protein [Eubacteriales bacterium]